MRNFLVAHILWRVVKLILWTCRIETRGKTHLTQAIDQGPCILAFWHNRVLPIPYLLHKHFPKQPFTAFISKSRDGQLLSAVAKQYPLAKMIAVPHDNRHAALKELIEAIEQGEVVLLTPDGPKGPRYEVKPGTVLAARITDANIVPLSWSASRFWQLKSWDRLIIPKPFSKIVVELSAPLPFSADGPSTLKEDVQRLESALHYSTKFLNEEVNSGKWPA